MQGFFPWPNVDNCIVSHENVRLTPHIYKIHHCYILNLPSAQLSV